MPNKTGTGVRHRAASKAGFLASARRRWESLRVAQNRFSGRPPVTLCLYAPRNLGYITETPYPLDSADDSVPPTADPSEST